MLAQEGPDKDFYRDDFNDQPTAWTIGTSEEDGVWMNRNDSAGSIMAFMVWFLLGYSAFTITFLAETGGIEPIFAMIYVVLCAMALACHVKVTFTDPGTVPVSAQPVQALQKQKPNEPLTLCSQCQTFKPPFSHHCRICKRCISRMDHHCPWMNNCIGAGNMKHFILFLAYTWSCSVMALVLLGWNYFFCVTQQCMFTVLLVQLSRITLFLSTGALLFTSSMLMNVTYGESILKAYNRQDSTSTAEINWRTIHTISFHVCIQGVMTGIGTIDRLKQKAMDTMHMSDEKPIPIKDIFGIGGYYTWLIPVGEFSVTVCIPGL
jgi:hypothetical protein